MNKQMRVEEAKHEAAKEVFEGTEYTWFNMLDNTADDTDRIGNLPEEKWHDEFVKLFKDILVANRYADEVTYILNTENPEDWGEDAFNGMEITSTELHRLADEWGVPYSDLLKEVEEK